MKFVLAALVVFSASPALAFDETFGNKRGCLAWLESMNMVHQSFEGRQSQLYRQQAGVPSSAKDHYDVIVEQNRKATEAVGIMVDELLEICSEYE